jgi:hypothetical protein
VVGFLLYFALRFRPVLFLDRFEGRFTRSGSLALPVARFHSSKVSGEISPLTSSGELATLGLALEWHDHPPVGDRF